MLAMQSCPLELATPGGPGDEQKREAEGEAEEHDAKAARNEVNFTSTCTTAGAAQAREVCCRATNMLTGEQC